MPGDVKYKVLVGLFRLLRLFLLGKTLKPNYYYKILNFGSFFLPPVKRVQLKSIMLNGVKALQFLPTTDNSEKIILYLHGGGYAIEFLPAHKKLIKYLTRLARYSAVMPIYRLAPKQPFPAALNDAKKCYLALIEQGFISKNIAIGGDSAGGGLTFALFHLLEKERLPLPGKLFAFSPWLDLSANGTDIKLKQKEDPFLKLKDLRIFANFYANNKLENPLVSPLYAEFKNLPEVVIHVGTKEVLLLQNRQFAKKNNAITFTYKEFEGMIHVFHAFFGISRRAKSALLEIGNLVRK